FRDLPGLDQHREPRPVQICPTNTSWPSLTRNDFGMCVSSLGWYALPDWLAKGLVPRSGDRTTFGAAAGTPHRMMAPLPRCCESWRAPANSLQSTACLAGASEVASALVQVG